jgi:hypothetical protein
MTSEKTQDIGSEQVFSRRSLIRRLGFTFMAAAALPVAGAMLVRPASAGTHPELASAPSKKKKKKNLDSQPELASAPSKKKKKKNLDSQPELAAGPSKKKKKNTQFLPELA